MKTKIYVSAIVLSLLLSVMLVAVGTEAADIEENYDNETELTQLKDSPWPSFGRDQRNNRRSPYDTSHVDGTMRWSFTTDSDVRSSPAVGEDGTIYVGSNDGYLYAINPDGTEEWSVDLDGDEVESSPAIGEDGRIYVGLSYHAADECLIAVDSETGEIEWRADTGSGVISSPVIGEDGTIYVASTNNHMLWAFDSDGNEEWSYEATGRVESSPAIAEDGTIYFGSWDGNLYAVDPDGEEEWVFESDEDEVRIDSSPAVGEDGTIYVGQGFLDGDGLYAINPDGEEEWRFETGAAVESSPAIGEDGTIYVGAGDDNLYAIDSDDGEEIWSFETGDRVFSSPAIGGDGTIYVGDMQDQDGDLYAVNPNGTEKWSFSTDGEVRSSPSIGEDGTIYVGSFDNNLYAVTGEHERKISVEGEGSIIVEAYDGLEEEWIKDEESPVDDELIDHVEHGTQVRLTAEPDSDREFVEWTGDETGTEIMIEFIMDSDKEVTAQFIGTHKGTIRVEGGGSVIAEYYDEEVEEWIEHPQSPVEDELTDHIEDGTQIRLTAEPNLGWYFERWTGDHESAEKQIEFTMDEEKDITAIFTDTVYDLEVYVEGRGKVTAEWLDQRETVTDHETFYDVPEGAEVTLIPEADEGWEFVEWQGTDETGDEITITMDDDKEITAYFEEEVLDFYELTVNIEGQGEVEIDPDEDEYEEGTEVTLTAEADEGWEFVFWTGDETGTQDTLTFDMDGHKTITANFVEVHEGHIIVEGEGSVIVEVYDDEEEVWVEHEESPIEDELIDYTYHGTQIRLTADPAENWEFDEWQGTDETGESIIITMDEDKEITAVFQEDVVVKTYELTLAIEGPGTVNYDLDREAIDIYEDEYEDIWVLTLEEGTEVTLYIDEDDEENFKNWDLPDSLTDELDEKDLEIVFEMDDDKEITANFEEVDVEGILDDLFERGMMCIALAIIIPIIIIVIIIVVIVKLVKGGDKGGEQPQQRPPAQQPPSQQQSTPPPEEEISEQQTQPQDDEESGEIPPPPPED